MRTELLHVTSPTSYWDSVRRAGDVLRQGGLVVFPTETVYGVAAAAENAQAVWRLRELKGRDTDVPFTVHIGKRSATAEFVNNVPGVARRLMERGWPGPLTLIFDVDHPEATPIVANKDNGFIDRVYHNRTVGLRFPDCLPACDLINSAGCVVLASSANRAARQPPTRIEAALDELDGEIDLALDAGPTRYAGPSTIVRIRQNSVEVLRQGVLDERTVRKLATNNILLVCTGNTCRSPMAEGLLKFMIAAEVGCEVAQLEFHGYRVISAGTAALDGAPATPEAVAAMRELGIDISNHRSRTLTTELIEQAQVVLVMTRGHRDTVVSLCPEAAQRCLLLAKDRQIEDPVGGSSELYKTSRDTIRAGLAEHMMEVIL